MTFGIVRNTLRWILLMAVQILVLNNIYLGGIFNPYIYILIVLSLPIEMSALGILLLSFFSGFILDVFTHTIGLHTMALTLVGFLRPKILTLVAPRDGYEFGSVVNVRDMGWSRYSVYALLLIFPHHLMLFTIEGFSTGLIGLAVQKTFVNSVLTFVLILLIQSFSPIKDKG